MWVCTNASCVFVESVLPVLGMSWNKGWGAPGLLGSFCSPGAPLGIQPPSPPIQILLTIQAVLFFRPGLPLPSCIPGWSGLSLLLMSEYGRTSRLAICILMASLSSAFNH